MPYTPHFLLQYGGTLGTKGEIWSNTIRMHSAADLDAGPDPADAMEAVRAALVVLFGNAGSKIGNYCTVRYIKFNAIGADGTYVSNTESNTRNLTTGEAIAGAASSSPLPFSVSCVVTWLTEFSRGRGAKGRLFSPGFCAAINGEGQMSPGDALAVANAYAVFLDNLKDVNTVPGDGLVPVVASKINGAVNPIERVSVGTVPDTMRSRRNQLLEDRQSVALP